MTGEIDKRLGEVHKISIVPIYIGRGGYFSDL